MIMYSVRGSISTKSFSMMFALVMLLYVKRLGKQAVFYSMAVLLLLTSIAKIAVVYGDSYATPASGTGVSLERVQPSSEWLDNHMPQTSYAMLADLSLYVIGLRAEMRIDTSQHLYFDTDELAVRLIERHDGQPLWDEALTLEDGTTTVSPFVTLAERA